VIEDILWHAERAGACTWWRTPERLRRVRDLGSGHFECVAVGEGPPDYVVLSRGVPYLCEAKSTSSLRWPFRALPEHQARALDAWEEHGGIGVLLLSVGGVRRAVPWRLVSGRWHGWDEGARSLSSDEVDALGFEMDLRGEWIGRFRDHSHP
jgi:hypothetical protein